MTTRLAGPDGTVRVAAILVACVAGFCAGEITASVLVLVAAAVTHFPGGYRMLATAASPPWWSNALGLVGLWCGFLSAVGYATVRGGLVPLARQWDLRPTDAAFVVLGVGCQFLIDLAYYPLHLKDFNGPVTHLFGGAHGGPFVLLVVMTTFGAPFVEEWFFRGVLFRTLLAGFGTGRVGLAAAIIISAVLFGLAHGELVQLAGLAAFGAVLAVVLWRTKRLVPSIITHVSFNAVAMVGLLIQRSGH